jgi:hypothetical protein
MPPSLDLADAALRTLELKRAEPDFTADEHYHPAALLAGETGPLLVAFAVPWALEESDNFRLDPDLTRLFEGFSYLLAIQGALVGAVFVGAASKLFRKAEIYPTWLAWGGLVIAALNFLLAVPIHGVSLILLLPWALVVSVLMLLRVPESSPDAK